MRLTHTKQGQLNPLSIIGYLLASPWILLGIGIFIMVMVLLSYFMMAKVIGIVGVLLGIISLFTNRVHWAIGLLIVGIGVMLLWNPGGIMNLSALPFMG